MQDRRSALRLRNGAEPAVDAIFAHAPVVPASVTPRPSRHVGRDDYQRRLTDRGRADARRMRRALAARKMLPEVLIHSGAARAKETAEIFAAQWKRKVELEEELGLYDASSMSLLALRPRPARTTTTRVGLVGHNPGLGELATTLAGSGAEPEMRRIAAKYPTGAVAVIDFPSTAGTTSSASPALLGALPDPGRARGRRGLTPLCKPARAP